MVRRLESQGKCIFCEQLIGFSSMTRHLQSCEKRNGVLLKEDLKNSKFYGLKIWATYNPSYWLFVEVLEDASFEHLDNFLRQVWLECCGHLSAFTLGDVRYEAQTGAPDFMFSMFRQIQSKPINVNFNKSLFKGLEFHYEYDFGSTTDLDLKVVWEREGKWNKNGLLLLARNEAFVLNCEGCGQTAGLICTECSFEKEAVYCNKCIEKHKCGGEMFLPIVNSPRMGVCGYTGSESEEDTDDVGVESNAMPISIEAKVGRNEPCPCGSGKKHKKCCLP